MTNEASHSSRNVFGIVERFWGWRNRFALPALFAAVGIVAAACGSSASSNANGGSTGQSSTSFIGQLHTLSKIASTVPGNGDVNPYGVAVVATSSGLLTAGDTLVSNFNSKSNLQGTGTTIVQVSPGGSMQVFSQLSNLPQGMSCPGGVGLTTALGILPGNWVVVGSLPTSAGGALPGRDPVGCLIVLNDQGVAVETITNSNIVGPWDLTVRSDTTSAQIFVSNALGGNTSTDNGVPVAGNCTIVRLDLTISASAPPALVGTTVIGKDFLRRANKAALVLAPTGLALGSNGTLYVDDTQTNSVSAIPNAVARTSAVTASGTTISSGGSLNAPLGMTLVPNGDLVVVNGNNGDAVEITSIGKQIATKTVVKNGAGDLFGITTSSAGDGLILPNDGTNVLESYHS